MTYGSRSVDKGKQLCRELEESSPGSKATYIEIDISLLRNVDKVCEEIQRLEKKINILFLTAGYMTLKGRNGEYICHLYQGAAWLIKVCLQKRPRAWITRWQ